MSPNQNNPLYSRILENAKQTVDTFMYKKNGPYRVLAGEAARGRCSSSPRIG